MWTTFKREAHGLKGAKYAKGFVSLGSRATNDYRHKKSIAYLANRYFSPIVKNFFIMRGVKVDEKMFALSELIQFIFRSQIREGKPINIYIPSRRMRNLLESWVDSL